MDRLPIQEIKEKLITHKITAIFVAILMLILISGFVVVSNTILSNSGPVEEVDLSFDPEGPYALLYPRNDGNALVLNLKRTASYSSISYELAYTSLSDSASSSAALSTEEGSGATDRGVIGNIDTKDKKGEYEQEILFGTCSKNVCKYDKGVQNGTLTLHIKKGNGLGSSTSKAYRMITQWHLQKPDVALGNLTSGDNHLVYKISDKNSLANVGYSIINDLTGVPKLPSGKMVTGKVYGLNVPIAKSLSTGNVSLELAENPPTDAKVFRFNGSTSNWEELDTKIDGSKLTTASNGAGIFAVLVNKK